MPVCVIMQCNEQRVCGVGSCDTVLPTIGDASWWAYRYAGLCWNSIRMFGTLCRAFADWSVVFKLSCLGDFPAVPGRL
jgi:hypothetical protein